MLLHLYQLTLPGSEELGRARPNATVTYLGTGFKAFSLFLFLALFFFLSRIEEVVKDS